MPTVRTKLNRGSRRRINDDAIAAWKIADEDALHEALRLTPGLAWEFSPLPREFFAFGVTEGGEALQSNYFEERDRYEEALSIQRSLVEAAGWPDCRAQIRKRISDLQNTMAYNDKRRAAVEEHFATGKHISPIANKAELKTLEVWRRRDEARMAFLKEALRLEEEVPGQGNWRETCAS